MTRLKRRLKEQIATFGPISVNEYMTQCLFDPTDGYYTNRDPFGAGGDFITAPEVSQMFGELVAVWLYKAWLSIGAPLPVTVAEIGPGRGTLMKDMLRTFERLDQTFFRNAAFAMIEVSPRLAQIQKRALASVQANILWHESIATLAPDPLLIIGNELFDAIPVRQFTRKGTSWRERMVALDGNGDLTFYAGAATLDNTLVPQSAHEALEGTVLEIAPARSALMSLISERIAKDNGAGLFFDYGYLKPGIGDTLQAVKNHGYEDVLANPGQADLTAHVDFTTIAKVARAHALTAILTTQGEFLLSMGLLERAGILGANSDDTTRQKITSEVERLAGISEMGQLFKALAVLPRNVTDMPFPTEN